MRVTVALLAMTKKNGGPFSAVWSDAGRFWVQYEPYGSREYLPWVKALELIGRVKRKRPTNVIEYAAGRKAAEA